MTKIYNSFNLEIKGILKYECNSIKVLAPLLRQGRLVSLSNLGRAARHMSQFQYSVSILLLQSQKKASCQIGLLLKLFSGFESAELPAMMACILKCTVYIIRLLYFSSYYVHLIIVQVMYVDYESRI